MRRLVIVSTCCAAVSGCSLAPGIYVNTKNADMSNEKIAPLAAPTIVPINEFVTHHLSKNSSCEANNGRWLCNNNGTYQYKIGSGDVLSVIVYDHPELTNPEGQYRSPEETGIIVQSDGTINYPFVGKIEVAGLDVEQIGDILTKKLAKYIQSPQLSVRVAQYNNKKIQVLGAVTKQQTQPITNVPLSLIDAINAAGGFDQNAANARYVYVIRGPNSHPTLFWLNANNSDELLLAENFYLQANDIVYVTTANITRWQRVMTALLPFAQATNSTASAIDK